MKPAFMFTMFPILLTAAIALSSGVSANNGDTNDQISSDNESEMCRLYASLNPEDKIAATQLLGLGERCNGASDEVQMEKRKPNFIRFGRSGATDNTRPNFLRFGRSTPNFLRFGRPDVPNFLRFGKSGTPNFLRFGRSLNMDEFERFVRKPNFIRFGRSIANDADLSPNFLRFGRSADDSDDFNRAVRKPNFLRFGR
jgi:hypothetical protein